MPLNSMSLFSNMTAPMSRRVEDFSAIWKKRLPQRSEMKDEICARLSIAQNDPYVIFLLCTIFHAFMIK